MINLNRISNNKLKLNLMQRCLFSDSKSEDPKLPVKTQCKMPEELTKLSDITSKDIAKMQLASKEDMQWRTPWHQKEGQYYSMLRTFYSEDNNSYVLKFLQQPIDLRPTTIKNWWAKRKEKKEIMLQQYIPERNQMLGNELAAAHFIVHRRGSVKFFGQEKWIKANDYGEYNLPKHYQDNMFLQAIDCTDMELYYEGLVNLRDLQQVEWFSLNGCQKLDDWALDRISNLFSNSLLYLDIRNMPLITFRGLGAFYKMDKLKILYVDDVFYSREFEMTCLMLQEINPDLDIRTE